MKILSAFIALAVFVGCVSMSDDCPVVESEDVAFGEVSVRVDYEDENTKANTDYVTALDAELKVNGISLLVFDGETGVLNATAQIKSLSDKCKMYLPAGRKTVYAVVNGPSLNDVRREGDMAGLMDDLSASSMGTAGLIMVGSSECEVVSGASDVPVTVVVRWLVSRIVLGKVLCNIPEQYGQMTLDCVYLGNANAKQYFSGRVEKMVNLKGYSAAGKAIGLSGVSGECESYMFRTVGETISVGGSSKGKYHMYCQPNADAEHTCVYILTTIGGVRYYYRVPLDQGLAANTTCSVEVKITNLGSLTPPDGDMHRGEIMASVTIDGWAPGNNYTAEF